MIEIKHNGDELNTAKRADLENEEYFKRIIDASKDAIIVINAKGNISLWNYSAEKIFGYNKDEVIGRNIHKLIAPPAYHKESLKAFMNFSETGNGVAMNRTMELTGICKNGETIPVELSLSAMKLSDGWNAIGIIRDVTERKITENALEENETRLIEAQEMAHVGNWELNLIENRILASKEAFNIYGIKFDSPYLPLDVVQKCVNLEYRLSLDKALVNLITKGKKYDMEFKIKRHCDSKEAFVHSKAKLIRDESGKAYKVRGTLQDITAWKEKEEEITFLSYHDQLTGLYNRRFFEEELNRLDTRRNLPLTIVMGDVNGLKLVNDSFGHKMGDEYLKKTANVISKVCRADDIIARLSGDEFTLILPKTDEIEAKKIIKRINELSAVEKVGAINISISFGYYTKTNEGENIQEVLKNTEDLMYKNKLYESTSVRSNMIDVIMSTLYEKNNREMLHSQRVGEICNRIVDKMDFSKDEINKIKTAGLMHDIGKIGIDEEILNAKRPLNENEWKQIKKHSEIGYRILSSVNEFSEISEYVLEHQECWDGSGYPKGLKGFEISIQARIIAVADAFDAMTHERSYGKIKTTEEAKVEINRCSGTQFDPEIVKIFNDIILDGEINN